VSTDDDGARGRFITTCYNKLQRANSLKLKLKPVAMRLRRFALASGGYPLEYQKGKEIFGLDNHYRPRRSQFFMLAQN
jgi:hypothetical protein